MDIDTVFSLLFKFISRQYPRGLTKKCHSPSCSQPTSFLSLLSVISALLKHARLLFILLSPIQVLQNDKKLYKSPPKCTDSPCHGEASSFCTHIFQQMKVLAGTTVHVHDPYLASCYCTGFEPFASIRPSHLRLKLTEKHLYELSAQRAICSW